MSAWRIHRSIFKEIIPGRVGRTDGTALSMARNEHRSSSETPVIRLAVRQVSPKPRRCSYKFGTGGEVSTVDYTRGDKRQLNRSSTATLSITNTTTPCTVFSLSLLFHPTCFFFRLSTSSWNTTTKTREQSNFGLQKYRVIHKSLRKFRTRLRNNQDRHGRKDHNNR